VNTARVKNRDVRGAKRVSQGAKRASKVQLARGVMARARPVCYCWHPQISRGAWVRPCGRVVSISRLGVAGRGRAGGRAWGGRERLVAALRTAESLAETENTICFRAFRRRKIPK
jgi:hypothetical protein